MDSSDIVSASCVGEEQQQQVLVNHQIGSDYISVPDLYHGRSIFITGGTGFMGKVSNKQ